MNSDFNNGIFIPFNTPSSKNSKRWTGKMLINSKTVMVYKKNAKQYYLDNKAIFKSKIKVKEFPLSISLYFIRDSKRKFDYINISQIVFDLMQDYEWLEDDSMDYIVPSFEGYHVDKKNCGVYIFIH
jgi:hypothetical protein